MQEVIKSKDQQYALQTEELSKFSATNKDLEKQVADLTSKLQGLQHQYDDLQGNYNAHVKQHQLEAEK